MNTLKPKLIIDTDPGHDDALAILMTVLCDRFDILAITTVAGNTPIQKVTRNAQAILDVMEADIPLYSGLPEPIRRPLVTAVVHGESGMAGFDTTKTPFSLTENAPTKLVEAVLAHPKEVTILALGPLSNVARAIEMDQQFAKNVKQLVMMGGAINVPGNKNRVAEFNFFVDPDAADIVFRSEIPKILVPLDACNEVVLQVDDFRQLQNPQLKDILLPMMEHFLAGLSVNEGTKGILVYDALAAYFLINPEAFTLKPMDILIETNGEHTFGMCVCEQRSYMKKNTNVEVVVGIKDDQFRHDFFAILNKKGNNDR